MCGIFGCISSDNNAVKTVIEGLKKLQYRGYDSCGIAYIKDNSICCKKSVGTIENLNITNSANIAIGHTRWATHGTVSKDNAHPHISNDGRYALVHNGIIENYVTLKTDLIKNSYVFKSQTDTEVIVNLIQNQPENDTLNKLRSACKKLEGSYAILLLDKFDGRLYVAKHKNSIVISKHTDEIKICSDIPMLGSEEIFMLNDGEFARIDNNLIEFFDYNKQIELQTQICEETIVDTNIKNYSHHMQKEIEEIPTIIEKYNDVNLYNKKIDFSKFKNIFFVACGTAYHACLVGAKWLIAKKHKNIQCYLASEFRYANLKLDAKDLVVFISQSGETADTIACAEYAKEMKSYCVVITNVKYSTLTKFADLIIYNNAGREVAVASTKAYCAQLLSLYDWIFGFKNSELNDLKKCVEQLLEEKTNLMNISEECFTKSHLICAGRHLDYLTAMEGALKIKEISYIPTTAIALGELKHGTLSLVDEDALCLAVITQKNIKDKSLNALHEIKARNGKIILITAFNDINKNLYDKIIKLPTLKNEKLYPIADIVLFQYLSYYISVKIGNNPDMPRNLAKSVTVE